MRARLIGRVAGGLGFLCIAALGLWQCAQDEIVGSTPSGLQFALRLREPLAGTVETVEIELLRSGALQAADTVAVVEGEFSATLVATAGDDYAVRVYGKGEGPALEPGVMDTGVVAFGEQDGITLRPGRVAEVALDLGSARSQVLQVQGAAGFDTLRVRWQAVPGASAYTLGWHEGEAGTAGSRGGLEDTTVTLTWAETGVDAPTEGSSDSVFFRVRPEFGARGGVYGPDLRVDLSGWVDLPTLTGLYPGTGVVVEHDTASVWLGFDRPMEMASLTVGLVWREFPGGGPIEFAIEELAPGGSRYRLAPAAGALGYDREYEVLILTTVTDTLGRFFDASVDLPGLQSAVVRWSTAPYSPLRVVSILPPAGAQGVDPTAPVRLVLNRAIDAATLADTTCFVTDPLGLTMPGTADTAATADTILWVPDPQLWFETQYTVHATGGLTDRRGRPLDDDPETQSQYEPFTSFFTTATQPPGPIVSSITPAPGELAVPVGARVRVVFSEPMDPTSVRVPETFKVLQNGIAARQGSLAADPAGQVFTFTPNTPFDLSTRYTVVVSSAVVGQGGVRLDQDREHPGYDDFRSEFRCEGPFRVTASVPTAGAQRVAVEAPVRLTFSGLVDPATVTDASVRFLRGAEPVACARAVAADSLELTLTPVDPLAHLTAYRVLVDTLVTAADGSPLDQQPAVSGRQSFELAFTTEPESINPRVVLVAPADGAVEVALSAQPTVTFSEPVDPASVRGNTLYLSRVVGPQQTEPVAGTVVVAQDSLSAAFSPQGELLHGSTYQIRATSLITSRHGFRLDQDPAAAGHQDFTSTFTAVPERVAPRVSDSHPRNNTTGNSITAPVQVLFAEAMDAASVTAAFSLAPAAGGAPVSGSGNLDATGELWTFTLAETLAWSSDYTLAVDTTATDLAGNLLDQNAVMTGRQRFTATFTTLSDSVAPRVTAMEPANGSVGVGVAPTDTVRIRFSEALASASVTAASFRVSAPGGAAVAGQALLREADRVIAWVPIDSLAFATHYSVTADTLLTDPAGNRLDQSATLPGRQPFTGAFTTLLETVAPRVLRSDPAAGETGVPVGAALAVRFSEAMVPATVPAAFHLTAGGAAVAGTGSFGAGDTLWTFAPDEALPYAATCALRVDTTAVDLSGNPLDQDRQAPHRQAYLAEFTTEADTYAPRAVAMDPDSGSSAVGVDVTLRVTFDEPLDAASIGAGALRVEPAGGGPAEAGTAWAESGGLVVAWAPADSLAFSTDYVLVADTLLTDTAGNGLDQDAGAAGRQPFRGPFRTRIENIPPRVQAVEPADGAAGVAVDASIVLEFTEPMNAVSVAAAFTLRADEVVVAGAGALDPAGRVWTFTPEDTLERSAQCDVTLDSTAVDLAGNLLDQNTTLPRRQPFASRFATVLDTGAPRVTASSPADGATGVAVQSAQVRVEFNERLAAATVTASALTVAPEGGQALAGAVDLAAGDTAIVWTATAVLEFATRYVVTADTTLTDRAGNRLDQDPLAIGRQRYAGFFTTMAETIPPMVTGVGPASPWPLDAQPTIFFSEPMDSLTLQAPGVVKLLTSGLVELPITLEFAPTADSLTLVPGAPLAASSSYYVGVSTAATDTLGNELDQNPATPQAEPYLGVFTTE